MDNVLISPELLPILQLSIAAILGMLLGVERNIARKTAGMRTYALVALASCLFTIISIQVFAAYEGRGFVPFDILRVVAGIITGIGFIGAGLIILRGNMVRGLTSAAALWVTSAIGVAVAFELYLMAVATTVMTLFIFTIVWFVEDHIKQTFGVDRNAGSDPLDL